MSGWNEHEVSVERAVRDWIIMYRPNFYMPYLFSSVENLWGSGPFPIKGFEKFEEEKRLFT